MNHARHLALRIKKTSVAIAIAAIGLASLGAAATHETRVEAAQARSLVSQPSGGPGDARRTRDVVSLERARLLAPRADFVRAALVSRNVGDPATTLGRAVSSVTPVEWSDLVTAFGWLAGLCLAIAIVGCGSVRWVRRLMVGSGAACLLCLGGLVESNGAARALAVVARPTGLLVAPYDGAGATADLPAGVVVVAGPQYGAFVHVRDPSGTLGWVDSGVLEPVVGAST
jgi:hypothetical protein